MSARRFAWRTVAAFATSGAGERATPDRIGMTEHDDGDGRRGSLGRLRRGRRPHHEDVDREPDELAGERGQPLGAIPVPPARDGDGLALDVAQLTQRLEEGLPEVRRLRGGRPLAGADADSRGLVFLNREPWGPWCGPYIRRLVTSQGTHIRVSL